MGGQGQEPRARGVWPCWGPPSPPPFIHGFSIHLWPTGIPLPEAWLRTRREHRNPGVGGQASGKNPHAQKATSEGGTVPKETPEGTSARGRDPAGARGLRGQPAVPPLPAPGQTPGLRGIPSSPQLLLPASFSLPSKEKGNKFLRLQSISWQRANHSFNGLCVFLFAGQLIHFLFYCKGQRTQIV